MLRLLAFVLAVSACSKDNDSDPVAPASPPVPTAEIKPIAPDFDPSTGFPIPPKRLWLYECLNQTKASWNGPDYRAYIEIMSDGSRKYNLTIVQQGYFEEFTATESKALALKFTPFDDREDTYQGSDVFHSMLEITKMRLNLSNDALYQLNLKNDRDGNLVLTLSAADKGQVLDIGGGVNYCQLSDY